MKKMTSRERVLSVAPLSKAADRAGSHAMHRLETPGKVKRIFKTDALSRLLHETTGINQELCSQIHFPPEQILVGARPLEAPE